MRRRIGRHIGFQCWGRQQIANATSMATPKEPNDGWRDRKTVDVLILGSGMAGLSCAAKLLDHPAYGVNGHKTLAVIEGRDRVGGRIGSVHVKGSRLDTGANWIHGVGSKDGPFGVNPLVDILPNKQFKQLSCTVSFHYPDSAEKGTASSSKNVDVTTSPTTESDCEDGWVRVDSSVSASGTDLVIPPKISSKLFGTLWTLIGALHERSSKESAQKARDISMLRAIAEDNDFKGAFRAVPKEHHGVLRALPQFVEAMEAGPLNEQSAEAAREKPGMGLLEYAIDDFDGDQVFLRDGYTAVLQELGKKVIDQGHVVLNAEVEHISWAGERVEVTTSTALYAAKRIICTLPLGVLQHRTPSPRNSDRPQLFSPPLPSEKIEAIKSLGFGTLDKIFLVYERPWWKDDPWSAILKKGYTSRPFPDDPDKGPDDPAADMEELPSEPDALWGFTDELAGIEIGPDGKARKGLRALSIMNLHALTGYPVLSCFVSCANARHVESLSDDDAAALVHRSLSTWLGRQPPAPCAVHVTRWAQDKFSRGSYSHMITGLSETRHRAAFGKPVINQHGAEVRFAGEHTSLNHFATVHGALLSGWREAEAIIADEKTENAGT